MLTVGLDKFSRCCSKLGAAAWIFLALPTAKADTCQDFARGPAVASAVAQLTKVAALDPPMWSGYDPSAQSYLFLSTKAAVPCAVIFKHGRVTLAQALKAPMVLPNGWFAPYAKADGYILNQEVDSLLIAQGIDRALAYAVDFAVASLGVKPYQIAALGLNSLLGATLVHEEFHGLGQIHGVNWPRWPSSAHNSELDGKCYRTRPEVEAAFRSEAEALLAATQLAALGQSALARDAAQEYLHQRAARRTLLSQITDAQVGDLRQFCEQNEAAMEMTEGVAQWVGLGGDFVAGTMHLDQLIQYVHADLSYNYFYYNFGMLQLYLLRQLSPADFAAVTKSLATSPNAQTNIESIFRDKFSAPR